MPMIIAVIIESAILICVLWLLFFLSTLLHELGHALGYMTASGKRRWHIRIGWGKCLIDTKTLTVNLLPFDGLFTPLEEDGTDTKAKRIIMLSGGPAASLITAAVLLLLRFRGVTVSSGFIASGAAESFISIALYVNLFILIQSVIPVRYFYGKIKGLESDGLQIINIVRNREK